MQDARGENQSRGRKLIFIYLFFYFHHVIHFQWAHVTGQMDLWSRCQLLKIRFREEEEKKRKKKKRPSSKISLASLRKCISVHLRGV